MLQPVSRSPVPCLGQFFRRDEPKPQLPSKRRRDDICRLGSTSKSFTIKPYSDCPHDEPVTLKPVRVISRSQLPLNFLDTISDDKFVAIRHFTTHIDVLEHDVEPAEKESPRVLIAQHESTKMLYAVERVQSHVYSIGRLKPWLKEKEVADLWDPSAVPKISPMLPLRPRDGASMSEWWQHAAVDTEAGQQNVKRVKIAMMRPRQPSEKFCVDMSRTIHCGAESREPLPVPVDLCGTNIESVPELPTPEEHQSSLVQQYLDAVYLSKTSLAYFAKGPITRIRNVFTCPDEGAPQTNELVSFLRTMLLSPKASEKKYYEKLPALVKALPPGSLSDEDSLPASTKLKKTKKKLKLSRDGIYPQEGTFVKRWWWSEMRSGDSVGGETIDQRIKRRVGELRVRETLAQLILMLEIIALEALSTYRPPTDGSVVDATGLDPEDMQMNPKKRKKKLEDINLQLDLLLDKLCIWHATEEAGILDLDAKFPKQIESVDMRGKNGSSDRLHSFCVEVIIPFYVNRLPERALMVNKKLGGPAHQLPSKRKAMKPPVSLRKTGDSKEPEAKKSRRSLTRVATDNAGRTMSRTTPSLNRSATDSALVNGIKREGSEVPLAAIPFQRSPSKDSRRSMSQVRHLQGRQIDLAQPSAMATAKMKQKQRVEEDLQDAILALKKPNRDLAAGSYIAEIEERGLGVTAKSRKPSNPARKVIKDIQVTATPRVARRTKNVIEQTPTHRGSKSSTTATEDVLPSSSFWIPSSGARATSSVIPATAPRSATAGRGLVDDDIAETPSKAPNTKTFSSGAARRTIFATPSKKSFQASNPESTACSSIFETPVKVVGISPPSKLNFVLPAIQATPVKAISLPPKADDECSTAVPVKESAEPSIYDALGWNDDDDDIQ